MGRVYNALLKAERLSDRERPIGYPARPFRVQPAFRSDEQVAPGHDYRSPDSVATLDLAQRRPASVPTALPAAEEFDFNDAIALSEATAGSQHRCVVAPHTAPVIPAPTIPEAFVEPRTIRNVSDLRIGAHLAALRGEDRLACERYRTLGVRLLNLGARRKLKTVLVTSSEEGEGKSTIAANLAWSIAKPSERRVLLLDANPDSSSSLSRLFGMNTVRGWIGAADGRCELADAVVRLNPNGLYLLMQGSIETVRDAGSSASDALTSPAFEKLIARLERDFDFLIIDSPPILESGGAQRLASLVDGTLFVVRAGHTHHTTVTDGLKLVSPDRQLGLVLNESEINDEIRYGRNKKKTGRHYKGSRKR